MNQYLHINKRSAKSLGLLVLYLLNILLAQVVIESSYSGHKSIQHSFLPGRTDHQNNQAPLGAFTFTLKHQNADRQINLPSPQVMCLLFLASLVLYLGISRTERHAGMVYVPLPQNSDASPELYLRHRTFRI